MADQSAVARVRAYLSEYQYPGVGSKTLAAARESFEEVVEEIAALDAGLEAAITLGEMAANQKDDLEAQLAEKEVFTCPDCQHLFPYQNLGVPCPHCAIEQLEARLAKATDDLVVSASAINKQIDVNQGLRTQLAEARENLDESATQLRTYATELETAQRRVREMEKTLGFFRSVIKGGESWSTTCQEAYDAARSAGEEG